MTEKYSFNLILIFHRGWPAAQRRGKGMLQAWRSHACSIPLIYDV